MNPGQLDNQRRLLVRDHERFAALVALSRVSVRGLADAAGWASPSYAHRLLKGRARTVDVAAAWQIARLLDVPVDDIFVSEVTGIRSRVDNDTEHAA